jgi:hypothetical protein
MKYTPTEGEAMAIRIIKDEKSNWEEGIVWITDKIAYKMRNLVQKARRNFFGVFTNDVDPTTQREKIFVPFTEWTSETMIKNIDIDTKDIEVKAKHGGAYKIAWIAQMALKYYLDKMNFGKAINDTLRNTVIDGTGVLKVWREGKNILLKTVDRLNIIVDPSAPSIDESSGVIERHIMTLPEFNEYGWDNSEYVDGVDNIDRVGGITNTSQITTEVPYVEVFERYGYLPKFCITENEKDRENYVYCQVCVSGLDRNPVVHKIKEVKGNPYQEFKLKEVLNRFDGRGIPEMVFNIQAYINEIINIRLNTARVVQLGLWKARGSITPQQLKRLFSSNVIKLDASSDIERLDTGTISESSYRDEEQAYMWGRRQTGTTQEEEMASSRPATNAMIDQQSVAKGYDLVLEGIYLSLNKLIKDKLFPLIRQTITSVDTVRITGDMKDISKMDEEFTNTYVATKIEEMKSTPEGRNKLENDVMSLVEQGIPLEQAEQQVVEEYKQMVLNETKKLGQDRFPEITKDMFNTDFDIVINPTYEQINKAAVSNGLLNAAKVLSNAGVPPHMMKDVFAELFDVMGLDAEKLTEKISEPVAAPLPGQEPGNMGMPVSEVAGGSPEVQMANALQTG